MSGNYTGFDDYADAEELANQDLPEAADAFETEEVEETRLAGIIVND